MCRLLSLRRQHGDLYRSDGERGRRRPRRTRIPLPPAQWHARDVTSGPRHRHLVPGSNWRPSPRWRPWPAGPLQGDGCWGLRSGGRTIMLNGCWGLSSGGRTIMLNGCAPIPQALVVTGNAFLGGWGLACRALASRGVKNRLPARRICGVGGFIPSLAGGRSCADAMGRDRPIMGAEGARGALGRWRYPRRRSGQVGVEAVGGGCAQAATAAGPGGRLARLAT